MHGITRYSANGNTYDIRDTDTPSFLKDAPDAAPVRRFSANGNSFDIPTDQIEAFRKDAPDAVETRAVGYTAPDGTDKTVDVPLSEMSSFLRKYNADPEFAKDREISRAKIDAATPNGDTQNTIWAAVKGFGQGLLRSVTDSDALWRETYGDGVVTDALKSANANANKIVNAFLGIPEELESVASMALGGENTKVGKYLKDDAAAGRQYLEQQFPSRVADAIGYEDWSTKAADWAGNTSANIIKFAVGDKDPTKLFNTGVVMSAAADSHAQAYDTAIAHGKTVEEANYIANGAATWNALMTMFMMRAFKGEANAVQRDLGTGAKAIIKREAAAATKTGVTMGTQAAGNEAITANAEGRKMTPEGFAKSFAEGFVEGIGFHAYNALGMHVSEYGHNKAAREQWVENFREHIMDSDADRNAYLRTPLGDTMRAICENVQNGNLPDRKVFMSAGIPKELCKTEAQRREIAAKFGETIGVQVDAQNAVAAARVLDMTADMWPNQYAKWQDHINYNTPPMSARLWNGKKIVAIRTDLGDGKFGYDIYHDAGDGTRQLITSSDEPLLCDAYSDARADMMQYFGIEEPKNVLRAEPKKLREQIEESKSEEPPKEEKPNETVTEPVSETAEAARRDERLAPVDKHDTAPRSEATEPVKPTADATLEQGVNDALAAALEAVKPTEAKPEITPEASSESATAPTQEKSEPTAQKAQPPALAQAQAEAKTADAKRAEKMETPALEDEIAALESVGNLSKKRQRQLAAYKAELAKRGDADAAEENALIDRLAEADGIVIDEDGGIREVSQEQNETVSSPSAETPKPALDAKAAAKLLGADAYDKAALQAKLRQWNSHPTDANAPHREAAKLMLEKLEGQKAVEPTTPVAEPTESSALPRAGKPVAPSATPKLRPGKKASAKVEPIVEETNSDKTVSAPASVENDIAKMPNGPEKLKAQFDYLTKETERARVEVIEGSKKPIHIEVPGDGKFTVAPNADGIALLNKVAKSLQLRAKEYGKSLEPKFLQNGDHTWIEKGEGESIPRPPSLKPKSSAESFDSATKGIVSKDDTRLVLKKPFVKDGYRYASDGRIAVRIPAKGVKDTNGALVAAQLFVLDASRPINTFKVDVSKSFPKLKQAMEASDLQKAKSKSIELWLAPDGELDFRASSNGRDGFDSGDLTYQSREDFKGCKLLGEVDGKLLEKQMRFHASQGDSILEMKSELYDNGKINSTRFFANGDKSNAESVVMGLTSEPNAPYEKSVTGEKVKPSRTTATTSAAKLADPTFREWSQKRGTNADDAEALQRDRIAYDLDQAEQAAKRTGNWLGCKVVRETDPNAKPNGAKTLKGEGGKTVGWYDPRTKEVHLLPGADAKTVSHEIGWHATYDWAKQNNPTLARAMEQYAANAPEALKSEIKKLYGRDLTPAELLEEIGAGRFEREHGGKLNKLLADRANRAWYTKVWDGIKDAYKAVLTKLGFNRVNLDEALKDKTPEQAMEFIASAMAKGKALGKLRPGKGTDARPMEARTPAPAPTGNGHYIDPNERFTKREKWMRTFKDSDIALRVADERAGRYSNGDYADDSLHMAKKLLPGLREEAIQRRTRYEQAIAKIMREHKVSVNDIDDYLLSVAVPERNERLAKNGVTDGAGMTDAEAAALDANLRATLTPTQYNQVKRCANILWAMQKEGMQARIKSGRVAQDVFDGWQANEPHHIPMRTDFSEITGTDADNYSTGGYKRNDFKAAHGRRDRASSPTAFIFDEYTDARLSSLDNDLRVKLADFVRQNPMIGKISSANRVDNGFVILGDQSGMGLKVTPKREQYGKKPQRGEDPNLILFKEGGQLKAIELEGDFGTEIADSITDRMIYDFAGVGPKFSLYKIGMKDDTGRFRPSIQKTQEHAAGDWLKMASSAYASTATKWSPTFMARNFIKDQIELNLQNFAEYGFKDGASAAKNQLVNSIGTVPAINKYLKTKKFDRTTEAGRWLERYVKAGGQIGGVGNEGYSEFKRRFDGFTDATPKGKVKMLVDGLVRANEISEMMNRVANFRTACESGMGDRQAALKARNDSVDFNTFGRAKWMNAVWNFSNSVTGGTLRQAYYLTRKHGKKLAASLLAYGFIEGMAEILMNRDDDERAAEGLPSEETMSEYQRANSVYFRRGDKIYRMPIHAGIFSTIKYAGNGAARMLFGKLHWEEYANSLYGEARDTLKHFTGTGDVAGGDSTIGTLNIGNRGHKFNPLPNLTQSLSPSMSQGFTQLNDYGPNAPKEAGTGLTFAGTPLRNRSFNDNEPQAFNGRKSTPFIYHKVAQALNAMSGGNEHRKGNWDMAPEDIKVITEAFGKNMLKDAANAISLLATPFDKQARHDFRVNDMPFVGDLIRDVPENDTRYYEALDRLSADQNEYKNLKGKEKSDFAKEHRLVRRKTVTSVTPSGHVTSSVEKSKAEKLADEIKEMRNQEKNDQKEKKVTTFSEKGHMTTKTVKVPHEYTPEERDVAELKRRKKQAKFIRLTREENERRAR